MSNPWFRMYSEFASDPKVQMLSEVDQRRFLMLLCLRCSNGHVTLRDEQVAFQLRISLEDYAATKARLIAEKLVDASNIPVAWDKRQYVSDTSKHRVSKHRAAKKEAKRQACNVTVTPPDTDTDTDTEKNPPTPLGGLDRIADANVSQLRAMPTFGSENLVAVWKDGKVQLIKDHTFWLERFGGDEQRLTDALYESTPERPQNDPVMFSNGVVRRLGQIAGRKRDSAASYAAAVERNAKIKLKPLQPEHKVSVETRLNVKPAGYGLEDAANG